MGLRLALIPGLRAAAVAALVTGSLSGCALSSSSPVEELPSARSTAAAGVVKRPGIPADAQRVRVRWVTDGDTLTVRAARPGVLPQGRDIAVRLLEIDTPESKAPDQPVECFAQRATAATARLLPRGSTAWIQYDAEQRDRYGRALGYVWNAEGTFVNEVLVRHGFARVVFYRPNDRHLARMRAAEREARAAGRGLWSAC